MLKFGIPQGVGTALETLAFAMFLLFVGRLGEYDLAATSIACTLNLLAFLPMMGVGQAVEVLVGQYLGADWPDGAEHPSGPASSSRYLAPPWLPPPTSCCRRC